MKIIEALKQTKDLVIKADDLLKKISQFCAYPTLEKPKYGTTLEEQTKQVQSWIDARRDVLKEILKLNIAIQKTNLATVVSIELGGEQESRSIAEWIHRRRSLATADMKTYQGLTDRNIKAGSFVNSQGEKQDVQINRCYSPEKRDELVERYRAEPAKIDATLEIVNATTDLKE